MKINVTIEGTTGNAIRTFINKKVLNNKRVLISERGFTNSIKALNSASHTVSQQYVGQ